MPEPTLAAAAILDAAEVALRRFGPAKTSVIDVARALKVSHASLYRHFASKAELIDAVVARWLERLSGPLAIIAAETGPAPERMRRWFDVLIASQTAKAQNDPELFLAFAESARAHHPPLAAERERRATYIAKMIDDGIRQSVFAAADPKPAADAVLDATALYWHPLHAESWSRPETAERFDALFRLLLAGLTRRPL